MGTAETSVIFMFAGAEMSPQTRHDVEEKENGRSKVPETVGRDSAQTTGVGWPLSRMSPLPL